MNRKGLARFAPTPSCEERRELTMPQWMEKIIGPRAPDEQTHEDRWRFRLPTLLFALAAILLVASIFLPYWKMTLHAPQYPGGLSVITYLNDMTGDVAEIDGLNHYIGMRPLEEAAQLERSLSIAAIGVIALLVLAAIFIHSPFAALLTLPAMVFPFMFLAVMYYWLRDFGLNLDPTAPLSSSIDPFVPPILGEGFVAQFRTVAEVQIGFYFALLASILVAAGLYFQRKAYKPLTESKSTGE